MDLEKKMRAADTQASNKHMAYKKALLRDTKKLLPVARKIVETLSSVTLPKRLSTSLQYCQ
jgi:hypothetical protein